MKNQRKCRFELVSPSLIKRMPGLNLGNSKKVVGRARDISKARGYYKPVVLSDSEGCMTLLTGAATFEVCLEEKTVKVPAVIVQTEGAVDELLFALQSVQLDEPPDAIAVSTAIVRLIDTHSVTRKYITEALDKSPAWVNRMENLSRKLTVSVQKMVTEGRLTQRSAQEIARLPDDVQTPFAVSAANEFLSKKNITYLVNRYLNEDTGVQERNRIIHAPKMAIPAEQKWRGRTSRDISDSSRLTHAMTRCIDDATYLSGLLDRIDISTVTIRTSDAMLLSENLTDLLSKKNFYPSKT